MPDNSIFSIEIAQPLEEHARLVMQWRNDVQTLANFYHHEPKMWASFWPEFENEYFKNPELPPVFILKNGKRIAFLRFKAVQDKKISTRSCCDISVNLDPTVRGQGLGTVSLKLAADFLRNRGIQDILAEIRTENTASIKSFEKAGYTRFEQTTKHIIDTGEHCSIFRYLLKGP